MKISIAEFAGLGHTVPVIVHSLDQSLYQVTLDFDGQERLLTEDCGKTFRRRNLQQVREVLQVLPVASLALRQHSAYDEMIGHPIRDAANVLEVPLCLDDYPPPVIH